MILHLSKPSYISGKMSSLLRSYTYFIRLSTRDFEFFDMANDISSATIFPNEAWLVCGKAIITNNLGHFIKLLFSKILRS